jgi:hypothetical protein
VKPEPDELMMTGVHKANFPTLCQTFSSAHYSVWCVHFKKTQLNALSSAIKINTGTAIQKPRNMGKNILLHMI